MHPITTRFTKLLNITSPIVSAPMADAATPDMAAAVTAAGGFGFLGAGFDSSKQLKENLQSIRTTLKLPQNVPLPVGVGFLGWFLDLMETSGDPRLTAVLNECPVAIWFAFGNDLGKYVAQVRSHDAKRAHKTLIFVIVNSVKDALRAANEWKVDVLVAQGNEAGGHGGSDSPPLFSLLQAVLRAIPDGPPVLAAGGVSTGSQIAALLTLGAAGVVLGTRFLLTPECAYTPTMKDVLIRADLNATARSTAFDEVNRSIHWPTKHDGRAIANRIWRDKLQGIKLGERLRRHDEEKAKGEVERLVIWAGVGIGMTSEIMSASDVVYELHTEAVKALKAVPRLTSALAKL